MARWIWSVGVTTLSHSFLPRCADQVCAADSCVPGENSIRFSSDVGKVVLIETFQCTPAWSTFVANIFPI